MPVVAVVTDSSSGLPDTPRPGLGVVPMHVLVHEPRTEVRPVRVTTSTPTPRELLSAYRSAAAAGARAIVSVHLSAQVSGTCSAAVLAGRDSPVPVTVVDSRLIGSGVGLAALAGMLTAARTDDAVVVAAAVRGRAAATSTLFCVEDLDALVHSGRLSHLAARVGTVLSIRPLIEVVHGRAVVAERLRTAARARARLGAVAAERALALGRGCVVVVEHGDAPQRAAELAEDLRLRCGAVAEIRPVSEVLAAHAGPGLLAVTVAPSGPVR